MNKAAVPPMPGYLAGTLAKRWNELAPDLAAMGSTPICWPSTS